MTTTRSASANASSWSWVTYSAGSPVRSSSVRISRTRRSRQGRSSAPSGSSSMSSLGSTASARANATRCCSPPDNPAMRRPRNSVRPTRSRTSSTRRVRVARSRPAMRNPNSTLPATSRCGNSAYSWNIKPKWRRCGGTSPRSAPTQRIRPPSSGTSPATARSSVVFPQPLGPRIATVSPSPTVRSTASTAVLAPKRTTARSIVECHAAATLEHAAPTRPSSNMPATRASFGRPRSPPGPAPRPAVVPSSGPPGLRLTITARRARVPARTRSRARPHRSRPSARSTSPWPARC